MCNKIDFRIECWTCGYPYCEAQWPDADPPLKCTASDEELRAHIAPIKAEWDAAMDKIERNYYREGGEEERRKAWSWAKT
jgi:hypothetical protein